MRNAFVIAKFQPLRINQNQSHLVGRGFVQDRHDHGINGHALARAGRAGDQQMGHGSQIGGNDASVDVLAHGQRELRLGSNELRRLHYFAQPNRLPLMVRHLNANRRLSRHALNQDAFRFQCQAQVVGQAGYTAVLNSRLRFEFERGNHRPRIDLCDLPMHIKLGILFREHLCQ